MDEWIKEMQCAYRLCAYVYNTILLIHKKNGILPFAAMWMKLEGIVPSVISQTEKDEYPSNLTYVWNLRRNLKTKELKLTELTDTGN